MTHASTSYSVKSFHIPIKGMGFLVIEMDGSSRLCFCTARCKVGFFFSLRSVRRSIFGCRESRDTACMMICSFCGAHVNDCSQNGRTDVVAELFFHSVPQFQLILKLCSIKHVQVLACSQLAYLSEKCSKETHPLDFPGSILGCSTM